VPGSNAVDSRTREVGPNKTGAKGSSTTYRIPPTTRQRLRRRGFASGGDLFSRSGVPACASRELRVGRADVAEL
jgi:hypothetical protein